MRGDPEFGSLKPPTTRRSKVHEHVGHRNGAMRAGEPRVRCRTGSRMSIKYDSGRKPMSTRWYGDLQPRRIETIASAWGLVAEPLACAQRDTGVGDGAQQPVAVPDDRLLERHHPRATAQVTLAGPRRSAPTTRFERSAVPL